MYTEFQKRQYMINNKFEVFYNKDYPTYKIPLHLHEFTEIYSYLSGSVTYNIDGQNIKLAEKDIIIIPPRVSHRAIINNKNERYERYVIWISKDSIKKFFDINDELSLLFKEIDENKWVHIRNQEIGLNVQYIINQLYKIYISENNSKDILCNSLIHLLLVILTKHFMVDDRREKKENLLIKEVIDFIDNNLPEKLTLDLIADKFFFSKYYISHKFKEYTNSSIYQYIQNKRLELSKSLISKGISISDVYLLSGFNNYSNFFRAFKKEYGVTPKEFYRLSQNSDIDIKSKNGHGLKMCCENCKISINNLNYTISDF